MEKDRKNGIRNTWCLPGGHFEYGESLIKGAQRELEEETGIIVKNLDFLHIINDPRDESHYIHINFLAKDFEGEARVMEPEKFAKWQWFDIKELPEEIFVGHQKFIPAFLGNFVFIDNKKNER